MCDLICIFHKKYIYIKREREREREKEWHLDTFRDNMSQTLI